MARMVAAHERMRTEEEKAIQLNALVIENEVEARDLTSHLFSLHIIDSRDKFEIHSGRTRLERIRRLLDILVLRGPDAFGEFVISLELSGYGHVAAILRGGNVDRQSSFETESSDSDFINTGGNVDARLRKIENAWDILSRRLTKIESKVMLTTEVPEDELSAIKMDLEEVKEDTLRQVAELAYANEEKDVKIRILSEEVAQKNKQLQDAERKIGLLEKRIHELERLREEANMEINALRDKLDDHVEQLYGQEQQLVDQKFEIDDQAIKIQNQEQKLKAHQEQMEKMRRENKDLHDIQTAESERQKIVMRELSERVDKISETHLSAAFMRNKPSLYVNGHTMRGMAYSAAHHPKIIPRNRFQSQNLGRADAFRNKKK
ncbi:golgin subfamily A member 6-like protein 22 [Gigantopelta aegis]|uniref:golgin subfamily A member 6-like protein 22 n=1 Tax=Gigantopelta aegis TaxID=1735272 RepID=UPI001B88B88D|nr:golgin subfamily A member 6-like protein 22 [Gigantopelta aegis]XP_041353234.1 golgin subfamily A member 6-like protein 22 [Gigantopelta aegis]